MQSEFSPTWSCVSLTRSTTSSEWKLFRFVKMEVNRFQILLIYVTFYLYHVWKVVLNVLIKNKTRKYAAPAVKRLKPEFTMVSFIQYKPYGGLKCREQVKWVGNKKESVIIKTVPWKFLLFRYNGIIIFYNGLLFRYNGLLFRLVFCYNYILFRYNDLLFRYSSLLFQYNGLLFRHNGIVYYFVITK